MREMGVFLMAETGSTLICTVAQVVSMIYTRLEEEGEDFHE